MTKPKRSLHRLPDDAWDDLTDLANPDSEYYWRVFSHSGESGAQWERVYRGPEDECRAKFAEMQTALHRGQTVRLIDWRGQTIDQTHKRRDPNDPIRL